jgi:hypothetical protein
MTKVGMVTTIKMTTIAQIGIGNSGSIEFLSSRRATG